jgi:hemoglobin/transferrin/lactoferrin receptor protein
MRPTVVLTLFALNPVLADTPTSPTSRGDRTPDTLLVTATRTERAIEDVAATASVKRRKESEREIARDARDFVRYEPGV